MVMNGYWMCFKDKELLCLATVCSQVRALIIPVIEKYITLKYDLIQI